MGLPDLDEFHPITGLPNLGRPRPQHSPLLGRRVVIRGLSREALNGSGGRALKYDRKSARYVVKLDGPEETLVKLKPSNMVSRTWTVVNRNTPPCTT